MNGLCAQLTRVQIVHGVIHLAAPRRHAVGAQFQRLTIVSNRGIGISRNTISNVHSIPLRPRKAVRGIITSIQRFIPGCRMLHLQPGANGKATAQRQCAGIVQLAVQRITGTHQGIVSAQSGRECTLGGIDDSSADAAAQHHIRIQIDDAGGGGQGIGCNIHIQSTTVHGDSRIGGILQHCPHIHGVCTRQQIIAEVCTAASRGIAIASQRQLQLAVLHLGVVRYFQRASVHHQHGIPIGLEETACAAVAVHINARGILRHQLQQRGVEATSYLHIAAHLQHLAQSIIAADDATTGNTCIHGTARQRKGGIFHAAVQYAAIQHHGSACGGDGLAHRIHRQRTLLHRDTRERIPRISYDVTYLCTVRLSVQQIMRIIYLASSRCHTILAQHQRTSSILVRNGHAAINCAPRAGGKLHALYRRFEEPACTALSVHIDIRLRSLGKGKSIRIDAAADCQCAGVGNSAAECKTRYTFQRIAAGKGCRYTAAACLDIHPAHTAAAAQRTALHQQNGTIRCRQQSRRIGIHLQRTALHGDFNQLRPACIQNLPHTRCTACGQQIFIVVNSAAVCRAPIRTQ